LTNVNALPKQPKPRNLTAIRTAWRAEHRAAGQARLAADVAREWKHLERAHVLSQPLLGLHVFTHLAMLRYAVRRRDTREIIGQVLRILVAAPASATRRYPLGNTGGANVSASVQMPIPEDLADILASG
jgi:hypothetical protein